MGKRNPEREIEREGRGRGKARGESGRRSRTKCLLWPAI
jgi:hypothetical protein